jgi:hypothetical protein
LGRFIGDTFCISNPYGDFSIPDQPIVTAVLTPVLVELLPVYLETWPILQQGLLHQTLRPTSHHDVVNSTESVLATIAQQ